MIVRDAQDPHLAIDSPSRTLAAVRTPKVVTYSPREVPRLREQTRRMWNSDIGHAFAKIDLDRSHDDGPSGGIAALRGEMASLSREQRTSCEPETSYPRRNPIVHAVPPLEMTVGAHRPRKSMCRAKTHCSAPPSCTGSAET